MQYVKMIYKAPCGCNNESCDICKGEGYVKKEYKVNKYSIWAQREMLSRYGEELAAKYASAEHEIILSETIYLLSEELQADYKTLIDFQKSIVSIEDRKAVIETAHIVIMASVNSELSKEEKEELSEGKKKITIKQAILNILMKLYMHLIKLLTGRTITLKH